MQDPRDSAQNPSGLRLPPRLTLQASRPEKKAQQFPLRLPHETKYVARPQRLSRLSRIRFHPPAKKLTPPRRKPVPPRRIPKKLQRPKQSSNPLPECKPRTPTPCSNRAHLPDTSDEAAKGSARKCLIRPNQWTPISLGSIFPSTAKFLLRRESMK